MSIGKATFNEQTDSALARENAKLRQIIRLGRCPHPEHAIVLENQFYIHRVDNKALIYNNGFIEYCSDCFKVLEVYTPDLIIKD